LTSGVQKLKLILSGCQDTANFEPWTIFCVLIDFDVNNILTVLTDNLITRDMIDLEPTTFLYRHCISIYAIFSLLTELSSIIE
jgi:hypothetical protein